jgi:hypothetical protein
MPSMRWQHIAVGATALGLLFMACSSAETVEDDGDSFNGPGGGGGHPPDVTQICEDSCIPGHPNGETDYRAVRTCLLCEACPVVCDAEGIALPCTTEPPATDSCSASAPTCADCVAGMCALFQDPATTMYTGVCAAPANVCAGNIDCVGLNNCVGNCVASMPPQM